MNKIQDLGLKCSAWKGLELCTKSLVPPSRGIGLNGIGLREDCISYAKKHLESKRLCRLHLDVGLCIKILDPPSLRNRVKCGVLGWGLRGGGAIP